MKKHNRVELEIGEEDFVYQGVTHTRPSAIVSIDTSNDQLLNRIISVLTQVEDLEV